MPSRFKVKIKRIPTKSIDKIKELKKLKKADYKVLVGLPVDSNPYPDGTSGILVGATHEFGSVSAGIPERSFLRSTVHENRREYLAIIRKIAIKIIEGAFTSEKALNLLGTKVAEDVKQKIVDLTSPPNTEGTIASKGSSNPLIDTGHLRQSITYEVTK